MRIWKRVKEGLILLVLYNGFILLLQLNRMVLKENIFTLILFLMGNLLLYVYLLIPIISKKHKNLWKEIGEKLILRVGKSKHIFIPKLCKSINPGDFVIIRKLK